MSGRMRWERARFVNMATEEANPKAELPVTIRCRKCGHSGEVSRWRAENKRMRCSKCGWRGIDPKGGR